MEALRRPSVYSHQEPDTHLGKLLVARRIQLRLTQTTLADRAGISSRVIGMIEHGKEGAHRADLVIRLATALELSPLDLLRAIAADERIPIRW